MATSSKAADNSQRIQMVESQLRVRGIGDERVLAAMLSVERELFVPEASRASAYEDRALPIGQGQTISQPYMVAKMCELLAVESSHTVLEVGAGSGYQAAVLAQLSRRVVSIERDPQLVEHARRCLLAAGIDNVEVIEGDGSKGYPSLAPYDRIIVAAAAPRLPKSLLEQLGPTGRLVIPVGGREAQVVRVLEKRARGRFESVHDLCVFVPLVGEEGWAS